MYLGPYSAGRFGQMGMSANRPKLDQFCILKHFPVQNQNSKGVSFMKKLPSHVIRAPCGGPFWSNAWLPTGQIWADQIFLIILNLKCKITWVIIMQKVDTSQNWHSQFRPSTHGRIFFIKYFNFVL